MAEIALEDVQRGLEVGMSRARDDIPDAQGIDQNIEAKLLDSLVSWPEGLSPRFVRLFCELTAIAAVSRRTFDYPDLELVDIRAQLGAAACFFDSFRHDFDDEAR